MQMFYTVPGTSQHSRNVNCYYYFQRLGIIFRWDGNIESGSQGHSEPVCPSLYDVRHQKRSSTIINNLLSQQLISGIRLPIHIIATL